MTPISVAIVEDDAGIREMLTRLVLRAPALSFLESVESGEAALWEPRYHRPVVTGFFSYSLATSKRTLSFRFLNSADYILGNTRFGVRSSHGWFNQSEVYR
mgnify:CR=1 FL=1